MEPTAYIICATPRSGSTLLCDLLTGTGVAGAPNSFYRQLSIPYWIEQWGVSEPPDHPGFDRAYLDAALRVGQANTGMFGMRLMWNGVEDLCKRLDGLFPGLANDRQRFDEAFCQPVYLHLSRRDLVAQAVSRYRAETGGLWHLNADGSERERIKNDPVQYDATAIASFLAEVERDNHNWEHWFADNKIVPHRLKYEELSTDPSGTLARVLSLLGRDPLLAAKSKVRTRKLADETSATWVKRFGEEPA